MERLDGTSTSDLGTVPVQPRFTTVKVKIEPQDDDIKMYLVEHGNLFQIPYRHYTLEKGRRLHQLQFYENNTQDENENEMEEHGKKTPTEILPSSYRRSPSAAASLSLIQNLPHSPQTEDQNTTITDYAETTMNELLGMYGYEKVSHQDTQNLNLERYTATSTSDTSLQGFDDTHLDSDDDDSSDALSIGGPDRKRSSNGETTLAAQHRNLVSALNKRLSHGSGGGYNNENLPSGYIICGWCQKPGVKLFTLKTLNGSKVFCSEVCFTQCRRASFKKNKICDWCKHVRHTVNYVDFQDGETQLQFCSEKCLNQYKMNIFCQETQEHLQQIQASIDNNSSSNDVSDNQILITPDLWLQENIVRRHKKIRLTQEEANHSETNKDQNDKPKDLSNHVESPETSGLSNTVEKTHDKVSLDKSLKERLAKRLQKDPTHTASPNMTPLQKRPPPSHPHFVPSMFPHPAMNNWWNHAQMMASMGPGYPAFGGFPPVMYPGMFNPPFNPMMPGAPPPPPPPPPPAPQPMPETSRPQSRHINAASTPGPVVTPNASASSPDISQRQSQSPAVASSATNKSSTIPRNHQFAPMWPPVFPMMPMPPQIPQQGEPNVNVGSNPTVPPFPMPAPNWASMGIPPQTAMIPFPFLFPLPFPIPIPIPIPMTSEQIEKLLNRVSNSSSSSSNKEDETSSECEDVKPQNLQEHLNLSLNHHSSNNNSNSSHNSLDTMSLTQPRTAATTTKNIPKECITCASCVTPSKSTALPRPSSVLSVKSDYHASLTEVTSVKRPPTPASVSSIESIKRVRHESVNSNYDEVIDLSKDSSRESAHREVISPQSHTVPEHKKLNSVRSTSVPLPNAAAGKREADFLHVPKIHIVSTPTDPPLSQHLPLPPTDHAYSLRRGLILDAPSVPKRPKSPSPERRNYIRSMPRDIMEARRCLRTRIKTK